ncbi:MAG: PKD domain-containing protein [Bacteroidia bacterium]
MISKLHLYLKFKKAIAFSLMIFCAITCNNKSFAQLPPHFYDQTIVTGMTKVEGVVFDHNKRMYAWEKKGKIWIIDSNGVKSPSPLLNFASEVGDWVDHGLNGVALDPDFENNGYIYVSYVVDRHHLLYYGTPTYNKDSNLYYDATIARVTRYQCDSANGFNSIVAGSRQILIGETRQTGIPVMHLSHSACGIIFGSDGTLLVPTGDGAAYGTMDNGSGTVSYWANALADSIITPDENVGSFRSQMLSSMNGKILRIDPITGNGVPSNPYYDPLNPRSAQSRTYCLGLRNPYGISLKPGSGSTDPADGNPGVIYLGDVGWNTWEELDIADKPKLNFGWPMFEGLDYNDNYNSAITPNYTAPNPLFGTGGCTQQYFNFQDMLMQATLDTAKTFNNPCNILQTIPDSLHPFFHTRPVIEYRHNYDSAQVGIFNGNDAAIISIGDSLSPCQGVPFGGDCIIGGTYYTGNSFPPQYQNKFYFGEFEDEWIRMLSLDSNNIPFQVNAFAAQRGFQVHVTENPFDGSLIYIKYPDEIHRICYACVPDQPPVAIAIADTLTGTDSLMVNFDGSQSSDPDSPITFSWDFGDGNTSTLMNPQHPFTAPPGVYTVFTVVLTVTDDSSHTATDTIFITLNNTPPQVQITSFNNGDFYSVNQPSNLSLQATVTDAEQTANELFYEWKIILNTNGVDSIVATDTNKISSYIIQPLGCDTDTVYYKIILTVTDIGGLTGADEKDIYPDCNAPATNFAWINNSVCAGDSVYFIDSTLHFPASWQWTFAGGNPASSTLQYPAVMYASAGTYNITLTTTNVNGTSSDSIIITVNNLPLVDLGSDTSFCANSSIILIAGNNGATFLWNDGSSDSTLVVNAAGIYSVIVTDSNNCANSDSVAVTVEPLPVVSITQVSDTLCIQSPPVALTANPAGGTFTGNGVTGNTFNPIAAGLGYSVITYNYTDSSGCSNSDSVSIWVDQCLSIADYHALELLIYPNPAHDKLFIQNINNTANLNFMIRDVSGKVLMEQSFINSKSIEEISIKDFAKGFYIIQVTCQGKNYFRKIVIE